MSLPIPAEIIDDDRLAQAFREVFQMKAEFDLAEEIRKATKEVMGCYICGDPTSNGPCISCRHHAKERGEE